MGLTWTPVIDSFYDQAGSNRGRAMLFLAQGTASTGALTFSWSTINAALSLVLVAVRGTCTYVTNGGVGYLSSPGVAAAGSIPEVGSIMLLGVSDYSLSGDVGLDSDVTLLGKSGYSSVVKYQQTVAWRTATASEPTISTTVPS